MSSTTIAGQRRRNVHQGCDKPCGHFSHAARGVGFDKQMNVVGHYFQRMNGYSNLLRFEPQQRLKPSFDRPGENRAAIFWAPDEMIFQTKNSSSVFGVTIHKPDYFTPAENLIKRKGSTSHGFLCLLKRAVPAAS
jgi:hypothetical protein